MLEKRPVRHPETSLRDLLFQAFDSLDRSAERKQVPSVVAPAQDSIADLLPTYVETVSRNVGSAGRDEMGLQLAAAGCWGEGRLDVN